jgi:hypothetical protein
MHDRTWLIDSKKTNKQGKTLKSKKSEGNNRILDGHALH